MELNLDNDAHIAEFKYTTPAGTFVWSLYDPFMFGRERWTTFADNMKNRRPDIIVFLNVGHEEGNDEVIVATDNGSFEFNFDNGRIGGGYMRIRIPNAYSMFAPLLPKLLTLAYDPQEYAWLQDRE
jgi:hypothetical protein